MRAPAWLERVCRPACADVTPGPPWAPARPAARAARALQPRTGLGVGAPELPRPARGHLCVSRTQATHPLFARAAARLRDAGAAHVVHWDAARPPGPGGAAAAARFGHAFFALLRGASVAVPEARGRAGPRCLSWASLQCMSLLHYFAETLAEQYQVATSQRSGGGCGRGRLAVSRARAGGRPGAV